MININSIRQKIKSQINLILSNNWLEMKTTK